MLDASQITQLKNLTDEAKNHLIIFDYRAKPSILAAAASTFLALRQMGKEVTLAAVKKPNQTKIVGLEAVQTELGKQNLTISFDYNEAAVDKISYHIGEESKKFYLTIKPKKGQPPLDSKTLEFSYTGFEADIIYLFGVDDLENLDKLYFGYEEVFKDVSTISFHDHPTTFGTLKFDASEDVSLAALVFTLFTKLVWPISPDVATDLLYGIEADTDGFRSKLVRAETFDQVARLMKLGARRIWQKPIKNKTIKTPANRKKTKEMILK